MVARMRGVCRLVRYKHMPQSARPQLSGYGSTKFHASQPDFSRFRFRFGLAAGALCHGSGREPWPVDRGASFANPLGISA